MIDGKAAALAVRAHFEDVHGALSVLGFQLIDIKKNGLRIAGRFRVSFVPGSVRELRMSTE